MESALPSARARFHLIGGGAELLPSSRGAEASSSASAVTTDARVGAELRAPLQHDAASAPARSRRERQSPRHLIEPIDR